MQHDVIIVGQGISGTVLSHTLMLAGKRVLVIDDGFKGSSSMVAAGLWNPVLFKKLNKTWIADTLLPVAQEFYQALEQTLGEKFWFQREIVRVFTSVEEQNNWMARSIDSNVAHYLDDRDLPEMKRPEIGAANGYGQVTGSGNVNMPLLLRSYREHLKSSESLLEEAFHPDALEIVENGVQYKDHSAALICFCQGQRGGDNPWFDWAPLSRTKGELLTVRIPNLNFDRILNKGFFILPLGDDLYRVGATFNWDQLDTDPTAPASEELLAKLNDLLDFPAEIVDHLAGLRPTVPDRRPMMGRHPEHKSLVYFNGMGPKGVVYAPFAAANLTEHLYHQKELHPGADLARFHKRYRNR